MSILIFKDNDGSYALYSTNTDSFLHKNLTSKDVIFYKSDYHFDLISLRYAIERAKNISEARLPKRALSSYENASSFDISNTLLYKLNFFYIPVYVESKDKYGLVNVVTCESSDELYSFDEVVEYLFDYYYQSFSKDYIEKHVKYSKEGFFSGQHILILRDFVVENRKEIAEKFESLK